MNNNLNISNQPQNTPDSNETTQSEDTSPFAGPVISSKPIKRNGLIVSLIIFGVLVVIAILLFVFLRLS